MYVRENALWPSLRVRRYVVPQKDHGWLGTGGSEESEPLMINIPTREVDNRRSQSRHYATRYAHSRINRADPFRRTGCGGYTII